MKKILTLLSFLPLLSSAQITLEHVHVIPTGRVFILATDSKNQKLAQSGANQTWDYSNLSASVKDTSRTGMPFWYKGYTNFPESNYAVIASSDTTTVQFYQLSTTAFYSMGVYSSTDTSLLIYRQKSKLLSFPSTYNDNFTEDLTYNGLSLELGFDPDSTGPIPMLDSVRISFNTKRNVTMDGWGTMKTPLGNFNVLRNNSREIRTQDVSIFTGGVWIKAPGSVLTLLGIILPAPDTSYNVMFMTNSGSYGMPILAYSHCNKDTAAEMQWLYQTPKMSAITFLQDAQTQIYPNPCSDIIYLNTEIKNAHYSISNMNGRECLNGILDETSSIDIQTLSAGVYFIRVEGSFGLSSVRKLIIE